MIVHESTQRFQQDVKTKDDTNQIEPYMYVALTLYWATHVCPNIQLEWFKKRLTFSNMKADMTLKNMPFILEMMIMVVEMVYRDCQPTLNFVILTG